MAEVMATLVHPFGKPASVPGECRGDDEDDTAPNTAVGDWWDALMELIAPKGRHHP